MWIKLINGSNKVWPSRSCTLRRFFWCILRNFRYSWQVRLFTIHIHWEGAAQEAWCTYPSDSIDLSSAISFLLLTHLAFFYSVVSLAAFCLHSFMTGFLNVLTHEERQWKTLHNKETINLCYSCLTCGCVTWIQLVKLNYRIKRDA